MDFPHLVLARLYEHVEPIDRGNRYEDPLHAVLERANLGRVTGGGSQLNEFGGIDFADVEIELANLDQAVQISGPDARGSRCAAGVRAHSSVG